MTPASTYQRIYATIRRIPKGRVATYGQIAELADLPGHARQVGYALSMTPDDVKIPWHRVVNARGEISARCLDGSCESIQRDLLEAEGVIFNDRDRIPLKTYQWKAWS